MKIFTRKSSFWSVVPACAVFLFLNSVQAGFYVIPVKTGTQLKKIVLVGPVGTETENGDALLDALSGITDASSTNHYIIALEPGVYDIGSDALQMKSYVDIEGAGQGVTTIKGNVSGSNSGVIKGNNNAELRNLTVENTGGGSWAIAIYNQDSISPRITNVTVKASGGTSNNYGIKNLNFSSPTITNVTVTAEGGSNLCKGIINENNCSPTLTNVFVSAINGKHNYGVYNYYGSSPKMTNVTVKAKGGNDCYGVYNYDSSYPVMNSVTAVAEEADLSCNGIASDTSITMTNVSATAKDALENRGIHNSGTYPKMTHVTASASGGTNNYGIYNNNSSARMTYVTAIAKGGSGDNYGVYCYDSSTAIINHSVLSGDDHSVCADDSEVYIGDTQIDGTVGGVDTYTYTCTGVYNGNYAPCDGNCVPE